MIDSCLFHSFLQEKGIEFYTGVPDSLLKHFCAFLADTPSIRHLTAANEGGAVALATGHYLATGHPALVYMQNSGQGNAINPLVSLADPAVYGIPMLLLIGWRGEPGIKDEPQHVKQGAITTALCEALGIPFWILPSNFEDAQQTADEAIREAIASQRPVALIVQAGTFAPYSPQSPASRAPEYPNREQMVEAVASALPDDVAIVSTTGHISRELYEYRSRTDQNRERDFLTVGSMGHASQIALAIALAQPRRPVVCLDGDGALLMHMGSLAITGTSHARNLVHIVLNNGAHGSVGGQATVGFDVDFIQLATACGYPKALRLETVEEVKSTLQDLRFNKGPLFIEIRVGKKARKDLGRPAESPEENKQSFMKRLI